MIKLAIISIVVLFLVVFGISLFFPSQIRISKAVNMHTSTERVWEKVDDLAEWEQWNPFFSDLANKKVEYLDTSNGRWNAVKVETTTVRWKEKGMEGHIAEMQNGDRPPVVSGFKCFENPGADSITVQWYMDFKLGWTPWEKFGSMLYERKYGSQMEKGLGNLKTLLEK